MLTRKKIPALENSYYRYKTNFNLNNFLSNSQDALTSLFGNEDDVHLSTLDVLFDRFLRTIKNAIDLHAPSRQYSSKQRRLKQKPWITKTILKSVKQKNSFLLILLTEMTNHSNTIKNTVIYLPELKSARNPYITKMLSTMS